LKCVYRKIKAKISLFRLRLTLAFVRLSFGNEDQLELTPELAQRALDRHGETSETRNLLLSQLKEKILSLEDPSQRLEDLSDRNLIRFLRLKRFDLNDALASCILYQQFHNKYYNQHFQDIKKEEILFFKDLVTVFFEKDETEVNSSNAGTTTDKSGEIDVGKVGTDEVQLMLNGNDKAKEKERSEEGSKHRLIAIVDLKKLITHSSFLTEYISQFPKFMIRVRYFMLEALSHDPVIQLANEQENEGILVIVSCKDLTFWEELSLSRLISIEDKRIYFQQYQSLKMNFIGGYLLHEPTFVSWLWFLIKPMLALAEPRLIEKIHFCGSNYNELYDGMKAIRKRKPNDSTTKESSPAGETMKEEEVEKDDEKDFLPEFLGGKRSNENHGNWLESVCNQFYGKTETEGARNS
jgi:hypothetical protein